MKIMLIVLALSIFPKAFSQTEELILFQLDTKELIKDCKVTAFVDTEELPSGFIESINGSVINLQIFKNNSYKIIVNNSLVYEINSMNSNELTATLIEPSLKNQIIHYKIQIGAFSEPIPLTYGAIFDDLFIEKKDGSSINRLMTGDYESMKDVELAKKQILNQGFSDAFIVAYYNGERIELSDALKKEALLNHSKSIMQSNELALKSNE